MNRTKYVLSALCILVLMCLMPFEAFAQSNTIKGTVSSSDGPVIGATVKVKGSSNTGSMMRSQTSSMPTICASGLTKASATEISKIYMSPKEMLKKVVGIHLFMYYIAIFLMDFCNFAPDKG